MLVNIVKAAANTKIPKDAFIPKLSNFVTLRNSDNSASSTPNPSKPDIILAGSISESSFTALTITNKAALNINIPIEDFFIY